MLGERVPTDPSPIPITTHRLRGKYVTLTGLKPEDTPSLWTGLGMPNEALFDYLPMEAPKDLEEMTRFFDGLSKERGLMMYAIRADPSRVSPKSATQQGDSDHTDILGIIGYLNIEPANRAIEIGAVIFGPSLARTAAATEASYLLIRHAFGADEHVLSPPYRRVVWKCNSLNGASGRAAERLGFVYEGCFRKHAIVKGCNRDSNWYSIVDDEWPVVSEALEAWLAEGNFDGDGKQRETLNGLREKFKVSSQ
ncbi:hypothetical protein B0A48_03663 [Cryoendolithus antarcticus]|uniref:N-acetyltransferase domain-containing protein n=1 Tax=Cryoendolithus antarcticus TaxID=1507870 RepID=A0A1V8TKN6_9PEZI|nr:hypothetical protein B0A48_03663 [Cryoendolithus antarcticus]